MGEATCQNQKRDRDHLHHHRLCRCSCRLRHCCDLGSGYLGAFCSNSQNSYMDAYLGVGACLLGTLQYIVQYICRCDSNYKKVQFLASRSVEPGVQCNTQNIWARSGSLQLYIHLCVIVHGTTYWTYSTTTF